MRTIESKISSCVGRRQYGEMVRIRSAPIFCACLAMSSESSSDSVPVKIDTGTRPATVFTAISAPSLRSAMVRFSDSALWCGQAIAGAPWRT